MDNTTNYIAEFAGDAEMDMKQLEDTIATHPVSSFARFLLLAHYKKDNDVRYEDFARQTAVYLYNPTWSQFQLAGMDNEGIIFPKNPANDSLISKTGAEEHDLTTKLSSQQNENIRDDEPRTGSPAISIEENRPDSQKQAPETETLENFEVQQTGSIDKFEEDNEVEQENIADENIEPVNEQINDNFILGIAPEEDVETVEDEVSAGQDGLFIENEQAGQEHGLHEESDEYQPEGSATDAETFNDRPTNVAPANLEENDALSGTHQATQHPPGGENADVPFEPLHTIDYFASQGIHLTEETLENDQLGRQVKSFTAWLKTMKKLHPGQLPEQNDVIERIIQTSSEASNQNANVLTEAMADVLVKQNKREKAIEMYEKLSLLNPSKSAYFAAKIESLKTV